MNYSLILLFILISFNLQYCDTKKGGGDSRRRTESRRTRVKKNKAKDEAVRDITKRMEFFVKSWNNNDMDSVASISSENAVLMGHSMDTVNGRKAIRISVLAAKTVFHKIHIRILEIMPVNKKYAFHLEEWKGYDMDGNIVVEKGRSLLVWKKIKGEWFIIRHMFNYVGNSYR